MRPSEARWIAECLRGYTTDQLSPFLNVGSSTAVFREQRQPHIDQFIFAPLRERGVEIIHTDLKKSPGVDIAGDLMDPSVQAQLRKRRPRAALSSNLLEHVRAPDTFARAISSLVEPGGLVLATVPYSYPYHADPIDTGFRPSPDELAALFENTRCLRAEVLVDITYAQELRTKGLRKGVRSLLGALKPSGRGSRDRLRWMFRPYKISCVAVVRS